MPTISEMMKEHYFQKFEQFGPTAQGVDWGKESDVCLRYQNMLAVVEPSYKKERPVTLLDVGCGYGGLYGFSLNQELELAYTGIDLCKNMITYAREQFPHATFLLGDFFELSITEPYDYIVCNGILTQKLIATIPEMDQFANELIQKMFHTARRGIAFNVMTSRVNFRADNLYYRNPVELFEFCFSELTPKIRLDHTYPLYEYTLYLYHE